MWRRRNFLGIGILAGAVLSKAFAGSASAQPPSKSGTGDGTTMPISSADMVNRHNAAGQAAYDELSIARLLSQLAQAQDNRDFATYRNCFTEMITISRYAKTYPGSTELAVIKISAAEWAARVEKTLNRFDVTHHQVFNHNIIVEKDEATAIVDFIATHFLKKGDDAKFYTAGGRYHLKLEKSKGRWYISERSTRVRYRTGDISLDIHA